MSNVLPPDEGYRGVIIRTDRFDKVKCDGNRVIADMGISLPCLCGICRDMELSGIEELSGIPGSLGGAIYGNAGAYGREISDLINSVLVYDLESCRCYEISVREIDFGYRNSSFKTRPIVILSAELSLRYGDKNEIYARMRKIAEARRSSQPSGKPSLGSSFKRPEVNIYPWQLIDGCGLRGYRVGDAAVSQKHAGFIVNEESATTQDYLAVADRIQTSVKEKYGITLEREFELM
jgi:UDP-N-acetylmuramate dehydrogenase